MTIVPNDAAIRLAYARGWDHRAVAVRLRIPMTYVMLIVGLINESQYEKYTRAAK